MTTATLTWTAPTTRTDGSPLPPEQIAATHVFDGATEIGKVDGSAASFTTGDLTDGDHTFTVIVHDTSGNASAPSNAASVTVAPPVLAPPVAVADLAATVNP